MRDLLNGMRHDPPHSIDSDDQAFMRKGQAHRPHRTSARSRPPHHGYGAWVGISLFSVFLSACASDLYWAKPDAGEKEFEQDLRSCRGILIDDVHSETSLNPFSKGITDEALAKCMNSKGWFLAQKP